MRNLIGIGFSAAILALTSCGQNNQDGQYIAFAVSPSTNAPIIASAGSDCTDRVTYKISGGATIISTSASKYYIFFPNLAIQWKSTSLYLTVTAITATVSGSVLSGPQIIQISPTEIGYLLNSATNIIPAGQPNTDGTEINTNDAGRNGTSSFSDQTACPFLVGGITLANTTTTPTNFSLTVELEIDGFSTDANGNVANVRQTSTATAQFN